MNALWKLAVVVLALVVAGMAAMPVQAQNNFLGGTGDYATAANWSFGHVPVAGEQAQINGGLTATLNAVVAGVPDELWAGNAGSPGTFNMNGGSLGVGNWVVVGRFGGVANGPLGIMNISGGTLTKNGGGNFIVGDIQNNQGQMTVSGTGMVIVNGGPLRVGANGTGTLTLTDNASVTVNSWTNLADSAPSTGTLNMQGNSVFNANGDFNVGDTGSTGIFNLQDTATLNAATFYVGKVGTVSGTVNQTGGTVNAVPAGGADWQIGGSGAGNPNAVGVYNLVSGTLDTGTHNFQIGAYGQGTLNQSGGTVNSGQWPVVGRFPGSVGVLSVTGGNFNQTNGGNALIVGEQGTGTLNVDTAGTVNITGRLYVGWNAGSGTVNLGPGGTIAMAAGNPGSVVIANNAGSSGIVNQTGGSLDTAGREMWISAANGAHGVYNISGGTLTVGNWLAVGRGGNDGTLNISGTGQVTHAGGNVTIASFAGNVGTVNVTGGTFQTANELWVGEAGNGTLTVSGGTVTSGNWLAVGRNNGAIGNLTVNGGLVNNTGGNITIGALTGGTGTATVAGGTMQTSGSVYVGESGTGALTVNGSGNVAAAGALHVGRNSTANGTMTLQNGAVSAATLSVGLYGNAVGSLTQNGGTLTVTAGDSRLGGYGGAGDANAAGTYTLNGGLATFSGNFQIGAYGTGTLTQTGGTLNHNAGYAVVGRFPGGTGTLGVSGGTFNDTVNALIVGEQGRATVNLSGSGTLNANQLWLGHASGAAGAIYQTGGTLSVTSGASTDHFSVAHAAGSYGYFQMSGGTLNVKEVGVAGAAGGDGMLDIAGGTFTPQNWMTIGRGANQMAVVNVSAGSLNAPSVSNNPIICNWGANDTSVITVSGSGTLDAANGFNNRMLNLNNTGGSTGILNLGTGGTVVANSVGAAAAGTTLVNFNGGTLRAATGTANGGTFLQGLTGAYVYPGGAAIDTNGQNVTVNQDLLAPTGNGLTGIPVATGGAGYIGPPIVQITGGGGAGASAIAVLAGGVVTGITITNPGTGYTSAPTVALVGGGPTTAGTLGAAALGANSSGGLTKNGAGTLLLNGANNYVGTTTINAGTLQVGNGGTTGTLGSGPVVDNGLLVFDRSDNVALPSNVSGTGGLAKLGAGNLTVSGNNSYGGTTTVGAGMLIVGSSTALGSSAGGTVVSPWSVVPVNRYSFSETGGAGTVLADSIAGNNAVIVDVGANNATVGGGQVTLAGGGQGAADYVALPALVSGFTDATIETWATPLGVQNWSRIFDLGQDANNNLMMSWTQGTNFNSDRVAFRIGGGAESDIDNQMQPYTLGQQAHIVMTVDGGAGPGGQTVVSVYKDGVFRGTMNTNYTLAQLLETANYIGRSHYPDNTANASYNEFRIYNFAMNAGQVAASFAAGPDAGDATLALDGSISGDLNIAGEPLSLAGNGVGGQGALLNIQGNNTWGGPITLTAAARINSAAGSLTLNSATPIAGAGFDLDVRGAGDTLIASGIATGAGALTKDGAGTLTLAGASTYSGGTTVYGGTLLVNNTSGSGTGSGAVQVNAGTLGGTGSMSGPVTVGDVPVGATLIDSFLAPGNSPGILSTGSLTMNSDAALLAELWGPIAGDPTNGYDQVNVTGDVALSDPRLNLDLQFAPGLGDEFVLVNNDATDAVTGTFDGLPEGAVIKAAFGGFDYPFAISYQGFTGNDVVLTAVPEPGAMALAALAAAALLAAIGARRKGAKG